MDKLENQKILQITSTSSEVPDFIEDVAVPVSTLKIIYYKCVCLFTIFIATISLVAMLALCLSITKLAPEIFVDAQVFVNMSDTKSLVKREHIDRRMESREKVMINFMKQYVELRNTYIKDEKEMVNRWEWGGLVSYLSTYKVYKEFAEVYPKLKKEMDENEASRSVEILSVETTGGKNSNIWKVEFKTYEYSYYNKDNSIKSSLAPIVKEKYWTANISSYIDVRRRTSFRRLINPLGFVVHKYFQSEIDTEY